MIKIVIHIVLSFLVLTSGIGVSLYQHYCTKSHAVISSLALPASCDHDTKDLDSCHNLCGHQNQDHQTHLKKAKCCIDFARTIKIDLNLFKANKQKVDLFYNLIETLSVSFVHYPSEPFSFTKLFYNSPTILYNKSILVSFCTFLL